ncbi:MAG: type I-G CRISPR-associated protein Csb2 [Actinomycetota bacterium]
MSTAMEIVLPWGRFHATPWGRHVNEGAIDWPPAPWRLLRALYATWKTRCPDHPSAEVLDVIGALVEPPTYYLPDFVEAHTRHYMPDGAHRSGASGSTDKVIDSFVVVERGARLLVEWPVELSSDQRDCIAHIAERIPYLGRAETICELRLLDDEVPRECGRVYAPLNAQLTASNDAETVRVLAIESPFSEEALVARTTDVRRARLRRPPGTRWVRYARPESSRAMLDRAVVRQPRVRVDAVRWAIAGNALPSMHAALAMTDVLRRACIGAYGRQNDGAPSATLAGKDASGRPLIGHRHAHYLPLDADGDGLLDHLVVWAPAGFDRDEVAALAGMPALRGFAHIDDFRPCELGLEAVGLIAAVAPELTGPARRWRSLTPFAPGHHGRKGTLWNDHVIAQVRSELAARDLPAARVEVVMRGAALAFRRHRPTKERLQHARRAAHVVIEFAEPIDGPVALGALCHFGLGLCVRDE